jgi:hypothetical protein
MSLAAAGMAMGMGLAGHAAPSRSGGWRGPRLPTFNPKINRWTGEPHQHAREIARRLRQQARKVQAHV